MQNKWLFEAPARRYLRIAARLQSCGLELHPEKTKIVYCKDDSRKKTYPNEKFDFLGYSVLQKHTDKEFSKRQGKHTIDRFNRSGFAAFTTIDGMTTVPDSSRIGLGAKWKNSEGAR